MRVLVTGGAGGLGREVVPRLAARGHEVRVMSRRARDPAMPDAHEWAQADMRDSDSLASAVAGVDVLVHLASAPDRPRHDVEGTAKLLDTVKASGEKTVFFYLSIVGVDRIRLAYYQAKVRCEELVEASGLPHTILRQTQFHSLLDEKLLPMMHRAGFLWLPRAARFQLLDPGEAADHVVTAIEGGPGGRLPDQGGPVVQSLGEIARAWLEARGERRRIIPLPALGPLRALARAYNCCPDQVSGAITWQAYLERKYQRA